MAKLILFIVIVVLAIFFIGFNVQNVCSISLVFHTFENVHVFMPVMIAFLIGILVMVPFVIKARMTGEHKEKKMTVEKTSDKVKTAKKAKAEKESKTEKGPKVEIIHPENETEYVPVQHLDDEKTEEQK